MHQKKFELVLGKIRKETGRYPEATMAKKWNMRARARARPRARSQGPGPRARPRARARARRRRHDAPAY